MNENQQRYIGITLGPVVRTISKADKTREFWGASYLFSYLSRRIMEGLLQAGFAQDEIVNPSPLGLPLKDKPGVGLYSDQIFLQSTDATAFDKVQAIIKKCKQELVQKIIESIKTYRGADPYAKLFKHRILGDRKTELEQYLLHYFQVYSVEMEGEKNWFTTIKHYLEHLEMRPSLAHFDPDPIKVFLRGINHSFLREDAFDEDKKSFDSVYEVSTVDLRYVENAQFKTVYDVQFRNQLDKAIEDERSETEFLEILGGILNLEEVLLDQLGEEDRVLDKIAEIPGIKPHLCGYHRYMAIVHADVGGLGKFVGDLKDTSMQEFNDLLIQFSKATNALLAGKKYTHNHPDDWGYGCAPVYMGGDDLVFFAPIATRNMPIKGINATVFQVIDQIDQKFDEFINAKENGVYKFLPQKEERPSLDYGVSISYVKYPLQEAYQRSRELLDTIKESLPKERNFINFEVRKHSGQTFGAIMRKGENSGFSTFLNLIERYAFKDDDIDQEEAFLNSLTHNLEWYKSALLSYPKEGIKVALKVFFEKSFDEPIHQKEAYQKYLQEIETFLCELLDTNSMNPHFCRETQFKNLYGALRFIHFIREHSYE